MKHIPDTYRKPLSEAEWVLDVGCGSGWLSEYLGEGAHYIGIDLDPARFKPKFQDGHYNIDLYHERIADYVTERFDLVFMSHIIEHFTQERLKLIMHDVRNILESDGSLILIAPTEINPTFYGEWTHVRPYNHGSIAGLMKSYGFEVIDWDYTNLHFLPKPVQIYSGYFLRHVPFAPYWTHHDVIAWGRKK